MINFVGGNALNIVLQNSFVIFFCRFLCARIKYARSKRLLITLFHMKQPCVTNKIEHKHMKQPCVTNKIEHKKSNASALRPQNWANSPLFHCAYDVLSADSEAKMCLPHNIACIIDKQWRSKNRAGRKKAF